MNRLLFFALLAHAALLTTGCEPWGKPGPTEPLAADVVNFNELYSRNCSGCHGVDGMHGPGRILHNALYVKWIPREELHKVLVYGRPGTQMPPWAISQGGTLNEKQISALVDGIYRNWSGPVDLHGTELPAYSADISSGNAGHGKQLFARNCFMCHGPGAPVGLVTSASYLQLVSNQNVRTSIVIGRPDLGVKMPNYMGLNAGHALSNQDVSDLVTYIASLRPPTQILENSHTDESESGTSNPGAATGSKGSGNGPGSPSHDQVTGNAHGNSSQSGGTVEQRKPQH